MKKVLDFLLMKIGTATTIPTPPISRATPTSTNQRIDIEYDQEREREHQTEVDEEVNVDNTDDDDNMASKRPRNTEKHDINKNRYEIDC